MAARLARHAKVGHYDELRGSTQAPAVDTTQSQSQSFSAGQSQSQRVKPAHANTQASTQAETLSAHWTSFFDVLGSDGFDDLNRRSTNLRRQIRDNGVTYNVYADANGPQRPWSLDLFPLILSAEDWAHIEVGIKQRTRLLNHIMADVYGPQQLLAKGLLPAALVQGHPGYLRAMQGCQPANNMFLHIAAFDMARGPDGKWWVVSQRTQAPSGLGYLLENRLSISLLFPQAFRQMQVQGLGACYTALIEGMKAVSAQNTGINTGENPSDAHRIVLLTSGPYNETYFEHAYLARHLGLSLVEGSDLLVRGERLYLKTLKGLEPVHGVLKRLDDEYLDPLELRADSTLGVPGLLQVIRAGHVQIANAPGSAFLESSALLGFLPALSEHFLNETLCLPSLPTWWCGEQAVMQDMLAQLKHCVIKPTYPGSGMATVMGHTLSQRGLDEWAGRMVRQGEDYTVQAYLPLSQTPTWHNDQITPRSAMLRVFAVPDGEGGWQVLPGGLARLAGKNENIASMQHGGSSADVWALGGLPPRNAAPACAPRAPLVAAHLTNAKPPVSTKQPISSRAAENLFWLGRYTERCENSLRLAQITLHALSGEDQTALPLLTWLSQMAVSNCLVLSSVPAATQARRVFERSLIAALSDTVQNASVGFNLRSLKNAAAALRERLSQEQWHMIVRAEVDFFQRCDSLSETGSDGSKAPDYSSLEALRILESTSGFLAAMTGAQTDRMMRDDGWRLLSIGRHIERLNMLSAALAMGFETGAVHESPGFNAIVALFDSTITFHAQYQQRRDLPALLDLLVLDRDNPRSLAWVLQTLKSRVTKLASHMPSGLPDLACTLPDPAYVMTATLGADDRLDLSRAPCGVMAHLEACQTQALALSDQLSQRYFSHATAANHSLGT